MTKRTVTDLNDVTLSEETFSYDAAGNLIGGSSETGFVYDANNRLISIGGEAVSYDADGNMLSMTLDGEERSLTYDSANRLLKAGDCEYAYNAEDIRIRNLCGEDETLYTYDTNTKLSRLLVKTTSGVTTKYVYGMGLIGEETESTFKTYHFDYRGSTVAITDSAGTITDTFQYDTYGKQTARTGTSEIIFGYNGRDGVITDSNSLLYMRARYYSPELRRFINADIIAGEISNAITLNRYAYANGNPVSNVDPFGLSAERGSIVYGGNTYNIFIPNSPNDLDGWTVVKNIEDSDWKFFFSLGQFLTGFEADDFNGIADGSNPMSSMFQSSHIRNAGILGLALGALNSVLNSVDIEHVYYNITFYQKDDKRRAVIQVGSSSAQNLFDRYADDQPHSFMMENMTTLGDIPRISYTVKKWYDQLTGQHASMKKDYDLEVTADSAHKNSKYSSYLWIDSNGTLMETPMIYENDKVEIGYRHGFFWSKFTPLLSIPLGGSSPAPDLYQKCLHLF